MRDPHSLQKLLRPRSVAMIGASADVTRIGGRALRHLREAGFQGDIFPVNPGRSEVQGLKAWPTVAELPTAVDCAVLAVPTDAVLPTIEACAARGIGAAVIFSAGFAETGSDGVFLQEKVSAVARAAGMRLLGPNCLGLYNLHANTFLSFSGIFDDVKGRAGRLGLVSQSGGYAGEVVKSAQEVGLDFGVWVTTGNEVDVGLGEALEFMADSKDVDVVIGYIEGVRDSRRFFRALATAHERRKPVILLKVGRTEQGARAAASHTASLAGSDAVYDEVFRRYGAYRARTTEEMLDVAYAASRGRFPLGKRLAIVTNSGGIGVQAADFASDCGLDVSPASPELQEKIASLSPSGATANPIDLTGQVANDPPMFSKALSAVAQSGEFDMAFCSVGLIAGLPFIRVPLQETMTAVARQAEATPLALAVTAPAETVAEYSNAGFICIREPARAIATLAALASFPAAWDRTLPSLADPDPQPAVSAGDKFNEKTAKDLLAKIGIPSLREFLVQSRDEAVAAASAIDAPLAIKVVSADILHKSDVDGVALNVAPADAGSCVEQMLARVRQSVPGARLEGCLVSPMITGGVECFLGINVDPVLGPVVVFGLGGVAVELQKDVALRLAPVCEDEAADMIRSIKSYPLLDGFRGRTRTDIPALARAISALSKLAASNAPALRSMEVNPLVVMDEGHGVLALDAVIETHAASA